MYTRDMRLGLLTAFTLSLLLPLAADAQSLTVGGANGDAYTVSVSPQYPLPNGQATLSFTSSVIDLANASVTVSVAGKNVYQGAVQPVAVPVGRTGSITDVAVTMVVNGASSRQDLSIQPQDIALVAEPVSSSPVLYPGKSAVPPGGDVRVVAVANVRGADGRAIGPSALSYSWTVDGTQIANSSGIGKSAIVVAAPFQYRLRAVSVVVTSQDGSLSGGAALSLSAGDPLVRIYENDPLLGILFNKALSRFSIPGAESTLYAAPFSFPTTSGAPLLQWFLNGTAAQVGNSITLRPTGSGEGSASLSLVASAGANTTATINIPLSFGAAQSTNFFGL
jgi:hypothetical protein